MSGSDIIFKIFLTLIFLAAAPELHAAIYERTQLVFGDVELSIRIETALARGKAFRAIEKGFAVAKKQNEIFSTFLPDSEISRLNALPKPARGVRVSREMAQVLKKALGTTRLTRGFFDLTFEMDDSGADAIRFRGNRKLDLSRSDLRLNPTGLVKGDTVDRILALLKKNPRIRAALVAAGGDIGRFDRDGGTEAIPLFNPLPRTRALNVTLGNGAVSTSGFYERGRHVKNTRHSPIEHLQVSVTAQDGATSDGLDNAFLYMPLEEIRATLKSIPGTRAIVYEKNGNIHFLP